ncbi:MAG TPA: SPFH domain-containing protein [Acidimicrobiales bacterium]|nr:SPFH domain-containing protein [Acidimicrobiales bacterium]
MRQMNRMYGYGMGDRPARRGRREVVNQWERGLLFRNGVLVRTLGPGAYRHWGSGYMLRRVDVRPWILQLPTQEVPTADGVTVKVTVAGRVRVVDPVVYVTATQEPVPSLYLAVQVALRELVAQATVDDLVAGRAGAGGRLLEGVRGVDELGVVVEQLELKDIVLPADLKRAQAQVLIARADGLAALERARGETAALRNLANAARLCAEQPALLQLRLLQQLAAGPGHTVVIGTPPLGTGSPA